MTGNTFRDIVGHDRIGLCTLLKRLKFVKRWNGRKNMLVHLLCARHRAATLCAFEV